MLMFLAVMNHTGASFLLEGVERRETTQSMAVAGAVAVLLPLVMPLALCFLKFTPHRTSSEPSSQLATELKEVVLPGHPLGWQGDDAMSVQPEWDEWDPECNDRELTFC